MYDQTKVYLIKLGYKDEKLSKINGFNEQPWNYRCQSYNEQILTVPNITEFDSLDLKRQILDQGSIL